ncbi:hypothetical protein [Geobacillus thermodenitrificans]|uniref:Uncharacterized protein n=1 Tax=Geobacillus thermodenitrificans TaxID=33940 RepID=A0ABY9Q908_GEOTD|nr:hypothetical protein [Geobacillus thermodenitrificans]WMV75018.1 hypothetical protein HSX42_12045 [Geobacillus thermodenitrificans]
MNMECPRCGCENAQYKVVEVVEGKGYVWEAACEECGWEDTKYEF